jgi:hypothetical protein
VEALEFMCSSADITAAKYAQASKASKAYIIIIIFFIYLWCGTSRMYIRYI